MEESQFSKSTYPHQHHPRHQNYNRRTAVRGGDGKIMPQHGPVNFRMLCRANTAGGVIGNSGNLIKQLENQTGCKIRFEEPLPNCHERVLNVIGDATINRKIPLKMEDFGSEDNGEDSQVEVSAAQEGLMKVFERVLEVEGNGNGVTQTGCRLLAVSGQIGGIMGRRGSIVDGIRRNSGAKIWVLKKDQIPACATPEEELIQIMGDVMAVKKALVAVSHCLQACVPGGRSHSSPHGALRDEPSDFLPDHNPQPPSFPLHDHHDSVGPSSSEDVDRRLNINDGNAQRKVVFRLLCSNASAGGVIGKGATIVKSLEKETGASIKFSSPVAGSKERVATISSLESQVLLYSAAQIAIVRVFARSVEVGVNQGFIAGLGDGEIITARLLVAPNQINCLIDGGRIASDISAASGVEIQLMGVNPVPNCSSESDKVVQIVGEYENVKRGLFQVTGRLRDNLFCSITPEEAVSGQNSYSAIPNNSHHGKWMTTLDNLSNLSSADQANRLGFMGKVDGPHKPNLQGKQFKDIGKTRKAEDGAGGLTGVTLGRQSVDAEAVTGSTIEVVVPEKVFGSVYGENGGNLARLKEISGATVIVEDPSPGKCDGKVIISGTHERIQIAQSLLQAFLLT